MIGRPTRASHALTAMLAIASTAETAIAQPSSPAPGKDSFYKDRTVSLLIGFGSGGGNDTWARLIARHISRHIPGQPNILAQNAPGAGGLALANQIYAVSPRDGTVIASVSRGIPLEPLFGGQGTSFDSLKLNWIGSPDRDTAICVACTGAGIAGINDLYEKQLVMAATGSNC